MRVSFVNPPIVPYRKIMRNFDCATESKGNYLYQPYDFLLMSGKIPKDWPFQFIDCVAQKKSFNDVHSEMKNFSPEVIVCSVAATNWDQDYEFLKIVRINHPNAFLFVFGDLFIENHAYESVKNIVDGVFTSSVMFSFEELLQYKNKINFKANEFEGFRNDTFYNRSDLKTPKEFQLKEIKHEHFMHKNYRWPFSKHFKYTTVFTAWGCPYSCSYCILNKFPNYWREYTEIIEEMKSINALNIKEIYIGDRSFGLPLTNVIKLLDQMISEKFNFSWSTYFHPNQYNKELLQKMKESGCHTIIVGVESSDLLSLKQYGRHVRVEQFHSLIKHAKEIGMDVCGDFIIGLPGDTKESILKTIEFSKTLDLEFASFNIATPLAGSSIRELALSQGKMLKGEEQFDSLGKNKVVSVSHLTPKELIDFRNKAVFEFYMRPSYLFKRLIRIHNFEHLIIQAMEAFFLFKKSFVKPRS